MKKISLLLMILAIAYGTMVFAQAAKFKKINKNGSANILFSNSKIEKGKESKVALKNNFTDSEVIWARAYFPKGFGTLEGEAEGFIDMWIDGKHVKRLAFSNKDVPAENDQMMIYVHNTDNDDFKDEIWNAIDAGDHKIKIVVGKTQFLKAKIKVDVEGNDLVAKRDDAYKAVYLSESEFTYSKK
jgi:hypothetical protein